MENRKTTARYLFQDIYRFVTLLSRPPHDFDKQKLKSSSIEFLEKLDMVQLQEKTDSSSTHVNNDIKKDVTKSAYKSISIKILGISGNIITRT